MLHLTKKLKKLFTNERGASATEFALVLPVLILMFVGLFETGFALWGYLTLVNGNREAARYSVRADVLEFEYTDTADEIGYQEVIDHALLANSDQLNFVEYAANTEEGDPKAAMIVTHLVVDTAQPCTTNPKGNQVEDCFEDLATCLDPANAYDEDDLVVGPQTEGHEYLQYSYPEVTEFTSRLDSAEKLAELKAANDEFNCKLWQKLPAGVTPDWSKNSVMIVETFYEQPQLLGFPLVSLALNPVPLYAQTTLRIDSNDHGRCELLPIGMHITTLTNNGGWQEGSSEARDIWNGGSNADRGWLFWNAFENNPNADDLAVALLNPRMATTDYTNPADTSDTRLQAGDWVATAPGSMSTIESSSAGLVSQLAGKTFIVPVWDVFETTQQSGNIRDAYHVVQFAMVKLTGDVNLPNSGGGGWIRALLVDADVDACQ